jgi:outer membrane lipoprotein-sorting protein
MQRTDNRFRYHKNLVPSGKLMRSKIIKKSLAVLLILFGSLACVAAEALPGDEVSTRNAQVFDRIALAASKVKTLSSDFLQERHSAMLQEVVRSKGRFYFETPDRLRWELTQPSRMGFVLNGNSGKRWQGSTDVFQPFELHQEPGIKAFTDQVFAWIRADFDWLKKGYLVRVLGQNPVTLKLVPRRQQGMNGLDHLFIIFSPDLTCLSSIEIREKDGDFTRIWFTNTLVNVPLQKGLF